MYRNGIVVSKEDLVTIECEDKACAPLHDTKSYDGCLVSVGGGKDSVVSLEVLKGEKDYYLQYQWQCDHKKCHCSL